jgi:tetratricopeptide (TPR) repeat protein
MGRPVEAIGEFKRAVELDPLSLIANRDLGWGFYLARQYDEAIDQERKTLEIEPNFTLTHSVLGYAYLQKSRYEEGVGEFEKDLSVSPSNPNVLSGLGYAYAVAGRKADAQRTLDQLNTISNQKYVPEEYKARIYVGLGQKDKAFEWLEKAFEDRSIGTFPISYALTVDPIFDPLRSDPRFADLLRRMNLQP